MSLSPNDKLQSNPVLNVTHYHPLRVNWFDKSRLIYTSDKDKIQLRGRSTHCFKKNLIIRCLGCDWAPSRRRVVERGFQTFGGSCVWKSNVNHKNIYFILFFWCLKKWQGSQGKLKLGREGKWRAFACSELTVVKLPIRNSKHHKVFLDHTYPKI